jgi:hypothetical protein
MKGTLHKTEQRWVVKYTVDYTWDASLPLHPEDFKDTLKNDVFTLFEGREVEFEIVEETYDDGSKCKYAKLINYESSTKQEISDEEIEKAAANLANPNADKTDNWIEGAKWYREKLKQRQ